VNPPNVAVWAAAVAAALGVQTSQLEITRVVKETVLPVTAPYWRISFRIRTDTTTADTSSGVVMPYSNTVAKAFVAYSSELLDAAFNTSLAFFNDTPPAMSVWMSLSGASSTSTSNTMTTAVSPGFIALYVCAFVLLAAGFFAVRHIWAGAAKSGLNWGESDARRVRGGAHDDDETSNGGDGADMDGDEFELHNFVAGAEGVNKDDIYVGQSTVLPSLAGRHNRRGGKAGAGDKLEAPLLPLEATADGPMTTGESWSPAFFRETENHQRAVAPRGMASLPDAAIYSGQRSAAAARAKISTNANFVDTNAPSLLDRMMLPSHATVEGRIRDPRVAAAVAAQVSPFLARAGAFGGLRPDGDETHLTSGDRNAVNASARPLLLRDVASPNPMLLSSASASSAASGGSYYGGASRLGSPSAVGNATTSAEVGAARRLDDILFGAAQRAAPLGGLGARAPLPSYREAAGASRLSGNSYLEEVETRLAGYAVDAPYHARSLRSAPPAVPLRLAAAAPALRDNNRWTRRCPLWPRARTGRIC
jgi:hypothetical protein